MTNTENREMTREELLDRTDYLLRFMNDGRAATLRRVLEDRMRYLTVCLENVFYPQNASAVVRSCDAFGVQDIHVVEDRVCFRPNRDIVRGSDKWVDICRYRSQGGGSAPAIAALREAGYRIVATSPHYGGFTPRTFDVSAGKFALFFGTERQGISDEVRHSADAFICVPMYGFVESLNLSVCAATLLHSLTERVRAEVSDWRMTPEERERVFYRWICRSLRDSKPLLDRYAPGWRNREAGISLSDYLL